jgi:predicted HAD superfamily Cof-like phosphohydrolase
VKVEVESAKLSALADEVDRLREQVTRLQSANTSLVEMARDTSIRSRVAQFHYTMGIPVIEAPRVPSVERVKLRLRLIAEEFFEVLGAALVARDEIESRKRNVMRTIDESVQEAAPAMLVKIAQELCDLDYVVEGTRLEFGIDGVPVLREVHAANMRKRGGEVREDGKVLKPEGWEPPNIVRVLDEQRRRP